MSPEELPGVLTRMGRALSQIEDERLRQIEKGLTPNHDREHGIEHLIELAVARLDTPMPARPELIEAAALLVAALELGVDE